MSDFSSRWNIGESGRLAVLTVAAPALKSVTQILIGKRILVPLTTSLYVPGVLVNLERVMVDVGTGFYVEKVDVANTLASYTLIITYIFIDYTRCLILLQN